MAESEEDMKTKQELLSMLYSKLAELQDGRIKVNNPTFAEQLKIELSLLYEKGYNKAIDDFSNEIDKYIERYAGTIYDEAYYTNVKSDFEDLKKICNQLKAGV